MRPRAVCPLTASMAQDVAIRMATEQGREIDAATAQDILTRYTSWPRGSASTVRLQLRRHLCGAAS